MIRFYYEECREMVDLLESILPIVQTEGLSEDFIEEDASGKFDEIRSVLIRVLHILKNGL